MQRTLWVHARTAIFTAVTMLVRAPISDENGTRIFRWNRIAAKLKRLEQFELLARAKEVKARVACGEETTVAHDKLKQLMLAKQAAHVGN